MKTLSQLMDLRGRVALVTGGAGHIGRDLCEALAEVGGAVAVLDLEKQSCDRVAEHVQRRYGVDACPLPADLTDEDRLPSICGEVVKRLGRLDILVHCAAFVGTSNLTGWNAPFLDQSAEAWKQALHLNLTVPFLLTQSCAPTLSQSGHGSVINVASIYGVVGPDPSLYEGTQMNNPAAYAASKGGLVQLTRWLATVMAPSVRVNAIVPGGIERGQPESFRQGYAQRTPLRRLGTEEDVKGAVAYLASDLSAYVTGHNLVVDGGWTIW